MAQQDSSLQSVGGSPFPFNTVASSTAGKVISFATNHSYIGLYGSAWGLVDFGELEANQLHGLFP